jgi:hypothetical protein
MMLRIIRHVTRPSITKTVMRSHRPAELLPPPLGAVPGLGPRLRATSGNSVSGVCATIAARDVPWSLGPATLAGPPAGSVNG